MFTCPSVLRPTGIDVSNPGVSGVARGSTSKTVSFFIQGLKIDPSF